MFKYIEKIPADILVIIYEYDANHRINMSPVLKSIKDIGGHNCETCNKLLIKNPLICITDLSENNINSQQFICKNYYCNYNCYPYPLIEYNEYNEYNDFQ